MENTDKFAIWSPVWFSNKILRNNKPVEINSFEYKLYTSPNTKVSAENNHGKTRHY